MPSVNYKFDAPKNLLLKEKEKFLELLIKQGKVKSPSIEKLNNCESLCFCIVEDEIVSIGAIKPKSPSDFGKAKANLPDISNSFVWELGYCYTDPGHTGKGYSSSIVKYLIEYSSHKNLMASTELRINNPMIRILERVGFKQYGKIWKSGIHQGALGLFLRFIE